MSEAPFPTKEDIEAVKVLWLNERVRFEAEFPLPDYPSGAIVCRFDGDAIMARVIKNLEELRKRING